MPVTLNIGTVRTNLDRIAAEAHQKAAAALYEVGNEVMAQSKRLVPVDTGALKGSGYVDQPRVELGRVSVELGYGGPASAYAVRQHEDLSLRHPDGGQAKFLEQPLSALDLAREIAARVTL